MGSGLISPPKVVPARNTYIHTYKVEVNIKDLKRIAFYACLTL
jgi:hypothetical protein